VSELQAGGSCLQAAVGALRRTHPLRLSPLPLEEVHLHALRAAEASEVAASQGKFWQMHDLLYANRVISRFRSARLCQDLGVDMRQFRDDMKDHIHVQRVRDDQQSGRESGVRPHPVSF
jgi:protein-disulfide isomerase